MGLDLVEVVLEIEVAFEIKLCDDDYERCATVGGFHDVVVEKIRASGRIATSLTPCLSTAVFCKARESLAAVCAVERRRVRPSAFVEQLIASPIRRKVWRDWERGLGVKLPRLERPMSVVIAAWVVVIATYGAFALLAGGPNPWQFAAAGVATVAAIVAIVVTQPLAVVVPAGAATFRDLTSNLMARHATPLREQLRPQEPRWTPQEVFFVLKGILAEQLGVEPERVTPEARIIEDLGGA
jgi:acyl carrier protein